ncbi:MAG: hypothetical protein MUO85_09360, partial [candidate division Zixibacteria bacterium]|nr:hypothetical protein [candidate division Zixibacteria bacterium]
MELFGLLEASLAEKEISPSDDLVDLINKRINPPKPVTKDEVYIRTMFLVSDQINSYGGRFPQEELAKIVELVIDSPVMVGHKKEKLPIARNFKAELVEKDNVKWVKVWFYWLKSAEGALSLKENIDHGIYKECSVAFLFELPECSICKEDMRKCPHIPFKNYPIADNQDDKPCTSGVHSKAYFNYRGINQVLETSLVYRGAVPNTSISDELSFYRKEKIIPLEFVDFNYPFVSQTHSNIFFHLEDLSSLGGEFLVEPLYQGIRAQIHKSNQEVRIFDKNGNEISQKFPSLQNAIRQYDKDFILDGEIVKYRGKSRIPRQELFEYLFNSTSRDDFGFRFKLFDILYLNSDLTFLPLEQRKKIIEENFEDNSPVQKVRYQKAEANDLPSFIRRISSSEGAVIKLISSSYFSPQSWWLYKKNLEIDCLVKKVEKNKGGTYNYLCAISRNPEVKPKLDTPEGCAIESQDGLVDLGTTYSTHLEAKVGDVICVHADMIEKSQNGYRWVAPKVMEVRKDKNCSDSFSILERMCSCGLNLTSRSSEVKLKLD